jgi:hypothetical protein
MKKAMMMSALMRFEKKCTAPNKETKMSTIPSTTTPNFASTLRDALVSRYRAQLTAGVAEFSILYQRPVLPTMDASFIDVLDMHLKKICDALDMLRTLDRLLPPPAPERDTTEGEADDEEEG